MKRIVVCGIPYTITYEKDKFDIDAHFGQVDYKNSEIRINEEMTQAMRKEALCHELVHAMLVHIGKIELSQNEEFVQALGNAIHQSFDPVIKEDE